MFGNLKFLAEFIIIIFFILKMTMTASTFNRNCLNFINLLEKTQQFDGVKSLLIQWKDRNRPAIGVIDTFMRMAKLFQDDQNLVQEFNKCLEKYASIQKKFSTNSQVKQLAMQNQKSGVLLDQIINWIKTDQKQKPCIQASIPAPITISSKIQQLSQQQLLSHIQCHSLCMQISKLLLLYRRCIISLKQFKSLIQPIYLSDPSAFNMLFQYSQQLESTRRKTTIFAPLTDLVDQKYPVQQVGNSYIIIPDGYANYSKTWIISQGEIFLNRICCSVPLGSEGSFVIARKNQYEEQLFKNQEEKYQIDQTICTIRGAITRIQNNKNLNTPLLQKLLTKMYPYQNVFNIMLSQPLISKNIILPRLYQKLQQLQKCKLKFIKQCEQISTKNFSKSLDYRCFYFRKNDKKFNSTQRWEKQIQLRKIQILNNIQEFDDQVNDREALQHTRSHVVNTFDNITKQQLLADHKVDISIYNKKLSSIYPSYPSNQILFIMSFANDQVLNDVLQIILYHSQKKSLLQLLVMRLFKKQIKRNLIKDPSILIYIDSRSTLNPQNNQNSNTNNMGGNQQLNQPRKDRKAYKDITEQFNDLVEEDVEPAGLEHDDNPFEGPNQHTFICTKIIYNFLRYLLTIYQRFLKAKQTSDEKQITKKQRQNQSQITLYQQFLAIMIYKLKDQKQMFQQYLRKITNQQAFIYFTLDKFIVNIVKLLNNINTDSLTYKILKDQSRDYENQLKKWSQFTHPCLTDQLTRTYSQCQSLFRFTYTPLSLLFISTWQPTPSKKQTFSQQNQIYNYLSLSQGKFKQKNNKFFVKNQDQYGGLGDGVMIMKGEFVGTAKRGDKTREVSREFQRLTKFVKMV